MTLTSAAAPGLQGGRRTRGQLPISVPGRPLVSVITVVKNGVQQFERALGSVREQTYAPLEYLVFDGGSTDGTVGLLRRQDDQVDYWRSAPDGGVFEAMNTAVTEARGDWLLFLGSDDALCPGFSAAAAQCRDAHTLYYGDVFLSRRGRRYDGPFTAAKLARRNICHQAIFYPRAALAKYPFETQYRILADWVLNMHCWHDPAFRWQYVPETIAVYDDQHGLSSRGEDPAFQRDYLALVRAHFPAPVFWWRWTLRTAARPLRARRARSADR